MVVGEISRVLGQGWGVDLSAFSVSLQLWKNIFKNNGTFTDGIKKDASKTCNYDNVCIFSMETEEIYTGCKSVFIQFIPLLKREESYGVFIRREGGTLHQSLVRVQTLNITLTNSVNFRCPDN